MSCDINVKSLLKNNKLADNGEERELLISRCMIWFGAECAWSQKTSYSVPDIKFHKFSTLSV